MEIKVENGGIVLEKVYSGILLRTSEGNEMGICMRDDTFEINVIPKGSKEDNWHRVNMRTGKIEFMQVESELKIGNVGSQGSFLCMKKPVVVEAIQYLRERNIAVIQDWFKSNDKPALLLYDAESNEYFLKIEDFAIQLTYGDYIFNQNGIFSVCSQEEFDTQYEIVVRELE